MLIPKTDRKAIFNYLFQEGVVVAKKDFHTIHSEIKVPNLHVVKLLQSLTSKGLVNSRFSWQYYYYYLTNEGIDYLRQVLALPSDIVPKTFIKSTATKLPSARHVPSNAAAPADAAKNYKETATPDFKPEFKSAGALGRGIRPSE